MFGEFRFGKEVGIEVAFETGKESYFTFAPISTNLLSGSALVPVSYDTLKPQLEEKIFTGIDIDKWAASYFHSIDEILGPDLGSYLAQDNPEGYQAMIQAKMNMAGALRKGVVSCFYCS